MSNEFNPINADRIFFDKNLRTDIASLISRINAESGSPERTLAKRALQQARHWLGEDLAILGEAYPYPNGANPNTTVVDPPADVPAITPERHADLFDQVDKLKEQVREEIRRVPRLKKRPT